MNINVNIVPNEDAVVSTVEALESDMVKADSDNLSRFQNSRFDIKSYEGRDYDAVIINQSNPLLANANFRKAIVSAINRTAIIENGYMGHVHSVNIPINSKSKYYESSIKNMEYSTENAEKYMKEIKINKKDKIKETQVNATNKANNKVNSSSGNNKTNASNKPSSSGNSGGASNNTGTSDNSGSDANQAPSGGDSGAQNGGNSNAGSSSGGESAGNGATRIIDSSEETRNTVYSTDEDKKEFEKIADENNDSVIATNLVRTANNTKENANNQNNNAANNNQNSNNQNNNTTQNKNDADNKKTKKEENPYYTEKEIKTMINSITLKIIVNRENSERVKSANMISENLKAVGIKSEVVLLDSLGMQKSLANRSYDLAVTGWQISSIPNITEIMKAICPNDAGLNERLGKIQGATSEEDIKKIYADIEKYCIDNALFISIGVKDNYMIINKRLKTDLYMNDYDQYRGIEMVTPSK